MCPIAPIFYIENTSKIFIKEISKKFQLRNFYALDCTKQEKKIFHLKLPLLNLLNPRGSIYFKKWGIWGFVCHTTYQSTMPPSNGTLVGQQYFKTVKSSQHISTNILTQTPSIQIDKCWTRLLVIVFRLTVNPSTSVSVGSSPTAPIFSIENSFQTFIVNLSKKS